MSEKTARPTALAAGLALTAAVALAGCTSSGRPSASGSRPAPGDSSPATRAQSIPSGAALPAGVTGATAVPTAVPNKPALRANVAISSCTARPGGWRAAGTVHNPASHAAKYRITVFFTTQHATVIGAAATTVSVGAGAKKSWRANAKFHPAKPTLCVLRGVG
jgi:hypothetical protein